MVCLTCQLFISCMQLEQTSRSAPLTLQVSKGFGPMQYVCLNLKLFRSTRLTCCSSYQSLCINQSSDYCQVLDPPYLFQLSCLPDDSLDHQTLCVVHMSSVRSPPGPGLWVRNGSLICESEDTDTRHSPHGAPGLSTPGTIRAVSRHQLGGGEDSLYWRRFDLIL